MKRWKFLHLRDGAIYSKYGDCTWQAGEQKSVEGTIKLCKNGFHCSQYLWDALRCMQGSVLAEVEVAGDHVERADKECWRSMQIVRAWRWTAKDSLALAVYCAESVLPIFEARYPQDDRPRKAIEAARAAGDAWAAEAAGDARAAAWAAAGAAGDARAAAWAAAGAAEAAAVAAAGAAGDAVAAAWAVRAAEAAAAARESWNAQLSRWCEEYVAQLEPLSLAASEVQG